MNLETAWAALEHYHLPDAQITFLRQSQNTTFRVDTPSGGRFLLRLHIGSEAASGPFQCIGREPSMIESELLWLRAIAQDTSLTVPQPVQNRLAEWVTCLTGPDSDEAAIACSLLRWIEGEHLEGEATPQQIYQLGQLMANLHQHSMGWSYPSGFFRPDHNVEQLEVAIAQLAMLVQNKTISLEDYQIFQQVTVQIQDSMLNFEQTPDTWGLIHADLHQGNYVFHNDEICPIDFSRCGFGFYLYDVGESLGDIDASLRSHFFDGYDSIRALPANYQRSVESFFIGATVENFAFHSTNPQEQAWLSRVVPYVVKNHLHPYLHGETFLFKS